jgi:RNA polymerase sigma-70 factor (ECF subfamily)
VNNHNDTAPKNFDYFCLVGKDQAGEACLIDVRIDLDSTRPVGWSSMSDISVKIERSPEDPPDRARMDVDATHREPAVGKREKGQSPESHLMQRLAGGDEAAMLDLLELHGEMLARLVGRLTAWEADHEDVFQEVLLKIWQKASSYRGMGSLEGWLRRLAINRCYNHQRRKKSLRSMLAKFVELRPNVHSREGSHEPSSAMRDALRQLSANDRAVLVLYYLEEMSGEEVASSLGIKAKSLHVRLHRARKKLKAILSAESDE